jgi:hypothetical protein
MDHTSGVKKGCVILDLVFHSPTEFKITLAVLLYIKASLARY